MNAEVYINEYLKDCLNYSENISKLLILKKRGFYIDITSEGDIKLNDFSDRRDYSDLVKLWNLSLKEFIKSTYAMDSVLNQPVCSPPWVDKWRKLFGSNRLFGDKVPTLFLEPFIARFIHAVALCGIFTFYSCDGWHLNSKKNTVVNVGFHDRYSMLWTIAILKTNQWWKSDILYKFGRHTLEISLVDNDRLRVYNQIDKAARILYENRENFRKCKQEIKTMLLGEKKDSLPDNDILNIFTEFWIDHNNLITTNFNCDNYMNISDDKINCFLNSLKNFR